MNKVLCGIFLLFVFVGMVSAQTSVKKKRPLPYEYGRVVINNYSEKAGLSPVVFDHWLHRAKFTCRVCHVDIGFAMKAGATAVKATDNMKGYYCGACHNGKMISGKEKVFEACSKAPTPGEKARCAFCHSAGKNVKPKYDFGEFTAKLPKERFGNGVDWEKAEAEGLIRPVDFVENVSIKRRAITAQKDFDLGAKVEGMPDIIFSHKKHTVWNGCELCHPEIFVGVKKGTSQYSMKEIFEGKYCGVCHVSVAFPLIDCQRCHIRQVQ
ncbi:MAG TPA: c(7)-type cytochrome triheme domain-containing protein [Thermodesulfovibrionales bacterium]|nr:c(7)-type cytochrome triheme domain-containing protein [Thermodesulfovibrionales bacterium]